MGKCFTLMCPNLNQCSQSNMVPPIKYTALKTYGLGLKYTVLKVYERFLETIRFFGRTVYFRPYVFRAVYFITYSFSNISVTIILAIETLLTHYPEQIKKRNKHNRSIAAICKWYILIRERRTV